MESNGWTFGDISPDDLVGQDQCQSYAAPVTSVGYCIGPCYQGVTSSFRESGKAVLGYGNCGDDEQGIVEVLLNGNQIAEALYDQEFERVTFAFHKGDNLEIKHNRAMIKLNYLRLRCTGR